MGCSFLEITLSQVYVLKHPNQNRYTAPWEDYAPTQDAVPVEAQEQYNWGVAYAKGEGVPQNYPRRPSCIAWRPTKDLQMRNST